MTSIPSLVKCPITAPIIKPTLIKAPKNLRLGINNNSEAINSATPTPILPKGSVVYFINDPAYPYVAKEWGGSSKQASIILSGSDALQLLYKDPTLKVFYEDLDGVPNDLIGTTIYTMVARIY